MISDKKTARIAGIFYLLFLVFGGFSQIVRSNLVSSDATTTVNNILSFEMLFRISIAADLIGSTVYVFLVLFLYRLLKQVNKNIAGLMVVIVLAGIPVAMLNQLNQFAPILLLSGAGYLKGFSADQLKALALFFLDLGKYGVYIADIFWGLWLFPFGYLVFKSGFMPRIIGVLLMMGCFGFLIEFLVLFLFPTYQVITYPGLAVATTAELSAISWLLIRGVSASKIRNNESL